jgi:hypothetical protein
MRAIGVPQISEAIFVILSYASSGKVSSKECSSKDFNL